MLLSEMARKARELAEALDRAAVLQAELGGVAAAVHATPGADRVVGPEDEHALHDREQKSEKVPAAARPSRPGRRSGATGAKASATSTASPELLALLVEAEAIWGTLQAAAPKLGTTPAALYSYRSGKRAPKAETLDRIRAALERGRENLATWAPAAEPGEATPAA
ncbi:MAG: hypothetical protein AB7N76_13225 [Planctomycetota bacterium]